MGFPALFPRSMLDGRLRAGPEVLQPAEEDHDPRGERGREHSCHWRGTLHQFLQPPPSPQHPRIPVSSTYNPGYICIILSYNLTNHPSFPPGSMTATTWKTQTCTQTSQTGRVNRTTRSPTQKAWRRVRRVTATRQSAKTTHTSTWTLMNTCGKPRTWNSPTRNSER